MKTTRQTREFSDWLASIQRTPAHARILAGITKMQGGNFGDSKRARGGVQEYRIHTPGGLRIYFVTRGEELILLMGGDKDSQAKDVKIAVRLLEDLR
jgi:putative addiction module killer protein